MNPVTAFSDILNSNAFSGLMNLISFIGSFLTAPIWFGISLMNLLVISFCIHFVIGIMLGGIAPRSSLEKTPVAREINDNVQYQQNTKFNNYIKNFNPSPYDRMKM